MVLFKACPRCHGDMHTNRDMYGEYKECLQCGYMVDIQKQEDALLVAGSREKKVA